MPQVDVCGVRKATTENKLGRHDIPKGRRAELNLKNVLMFVKDDRPPEEYG